MSMRTTADEYFSKINPIASRMYVDMNEIKISYEDLWSTLSEDEQKQILSESIIKPEISVMYQSKEISSAVDKYAVKRIVEENFSYRDEHSGPFSFRTPSQRDLTIFEDNNHTAQLIIPKKKPNKTAATGFAEDILCEKNETESSCSTLPKTGLDFLDNW